MLNTMTKVVKSVREQGFTSILDINLELQDQKMAHLTDLHYPNENAEPRHTFAADIPFSEAHMAKWTGKQRLTAMPTLAQLLWQMNKSGNFYKERFTPTINEASSDFIQQLKSIAYEHGATAVKFVKVPADSIFEGKAIPEPYALVFTIRMDKEKIDTAPSFDAFLEVVKGYHLMAVISNLLTTHMRSNGFAAYPGTALGGVTDYSRIAEVAGLGAIGYHGLLITPEDGALLRINTIYTNITNLPIEDENPHTWVRDFCAMCNKCVRQCPAKAIFSQPKVQDNGRVKCIDGKACLDYFAANYGCGICIDVCPFSQVGYEKVHERFKGNPDAPQYTIPMLPEPVS